MTLPDHSPIKYGSPTNTQPPSIPSHLAPTSGRGFFYPSFDRKLWLFCRKWEPELGPAKATLMILHGTVDHSGVYEELAERLVQNCRVAVFAPDMRGWGLSVGESMYFHNMNKCSNWYAKLFLYKLKLFKVRKFYYPSNMLQLPPSIFKT